MKIFQTSIAILCAVAFAAYAQESVELVKDNTDGSGVNTSLNLGATMTDGNSETRQFNASLIVEGEKEQLGSFRTGVEGNYGKSTFGDKKETTVEDVSAFADFKKTLTEMTYASLKGSFLYDDIAEVDYRFIISPGVGMYFIKDDDTSLSLDFGPAYLWEKVAKETDDEFLLRFSERLECKLSKTAKIWQSVEYLPTADKWSEYLLNFEVGIEALVTDRASLRFVLQDKYDSVPGEGLKKNDLTLIAGIGFQL